MIEKGNAGLTRARIAKNDEFYTLYEDVEQEIEAYYQKNNNVFRNKVIFFPCDDTNSAFLVYFRKNMTRFGWKKLIGCSYSFDGDATYSIDYPNTHSYTSTLHNDNGDFRNKQRLEPRDEADIIITNPPFSLLKEFLNWVFDSKKQFIILSNINAITQDNVFQKFKDNEMWTGATHFNTGMYFRVPDDYVYAPTYKFDRVRDEVKVSRVGCTCWLTNIPHTNQPQPLVLSDEYKERVPYDNYEAINIPKVAMIPLSSLGSVLGVPVTFVNKYCPTQFRLVGMTGSRKHTGGLHKVGEPLTATINGKKIYRRLLIQAI